ALLRPAPARLPLVRARGAPRRTGPVPFPPARTARHRPAVPCRPASARRHQPAVSYDGPPAPTKEGCSTGDRAGAAALPAPTGSRRRGRPGAARWSRPPRLVLRGRPAGGRLQRLRVELEVGPGSGARPGAPPRPLGSFRGAAPLGCVPGEGVPPEPAALVPA